MQTIYKKYDKSKMSALPRTLFNGKIVVVNGQQDADKAANYLQQQSRVGIDTETRPSFQRGQMHSVALLQVSTDDLCFLFRLNQIGLPQCVVNLLENEAVCKVGLSLNDDFSMLRHRFKKLSPKNVIDLQKVAPKLGIDDMSLQKLYANLLGGYISKRQQLTNWEADSLTDAQQQYAATDAWACLRLYDQMKRLIESHDYRMVATEE